MTAYRLYMLDRLDAIAESVDDQFEDDRGALARARAVRRDYFAVEVWAGQRLVGRVGEEYSVGWTHLLP